MFPGRQSWQQPVLLSGGPSGQKEEVYWQPSRGAAASSPCQKSGCYIGAEKKAKAGPLRCGRQQAREEKHGTDLRLCHRGGEARARRDSPVGGCPSCGERSGAVVAGPSLRVGVWLGAGTAPRPHPAATRGCSSRSHLDAALWGAPWRVPEDVCASAAPGSGAGCSSGFATHRAPCI